MPFREFGFLILLLGAVQVCFSDAGTFWETAFLNCDDKSFSFLLRPRPKVFSSVIRLLDPEGKPHTLKNDSSCGTSVAPNPDGSVAANVTFAGCYTKAQDSSYRTTIHIEGLGADGRMTSYKEELSCPEPPLALDTPSPSLCSAIAAPDRLLCGTHQVRQAECAGLGCCYSPTDRVAPCYYANKVTARCTPDGQFSIAISRNATRPQLSLESVHLLSNQGGRCAPASSNNMFVLFQFPLSACGTTFKESGNRQVYENELLADRQVLVSQSGSITRDSDFRLTVRCSYSAEDSLPISILIATPPPPAAVAEQGPLTLEMRIARDETYSSYYINSDYPVVKVLRDPVNVEVRILGRTDPALVLVLHECWATPSTNPLQKPEWLLLEAGCPYKGDNYQTQLVPVGVDSGLQFPSHYQRFVVSIFTFVDGPSRRMLSGPVYFHCSASACVPSVPESCSVLCDANPLSRSRRAARDHALPEKWLTLVTSDGPVDFFGKATDTVIHEEPRALPHAALMQWDDTLFLIAGLVAVLAVGTLSFIILRKHRAAQEGPNLSLA
ncbi:zona pellucida sperm-binding protein 4-like isoform X2 [Rhineura floridana]|uniref:zona pellucida sperm-binding protein 4-like isoform X2 n=1 Tax=Rhineura floridana TaxID=261503 RepID=UPI002AC817C3|nr:zona pellucida sperm-binding protein 4-like isoform X2 [Rhineura floridana]